MRCSLFRTLTRLGCLLAVASLLQQGIPANAAPPPKGTTTAPEGIFVPRQIRAWDDAAIAGLPAGSHPEVLSVYRVYVLALVRYRAPRPEGDPPLAGSLDPQALAVQAQRLGVADFERFCNDFFDQPRTEPRDHRAPFVDPSIAFFDVLSRLQAVDNAWKFVRALEQVKAVYGKMVATLPDAPRLDRLDRRLEAARTHFTDDLQTYRKRLNELKGELGLSPQAAVVPDRRSLARFRAVFDKADAWGANPDRDPAELPVIVAQLPRLDAGIFGQLSLAGVSPADPKRWDAFVHAAEQIALKNRGQVQGDLGKAFSTHLDLSIRHLLETRTAYQKEGQQWLIALQMKDRAFEQMMLAAQAGAKVKNVDMIEMHAQVLERENQIVSLWTDYQSWRLGLARDLGIRPGRDWSSFCAQIQGEPVATRVPGASPRPAPSRPQ